MNPEIPIEETMRALAALKEYVDVVKPPNTT